VSASSPTEFYVLELAKLAFPATIALILLGAILLHRAGPSRPVTWLQVTTGLWLVVTFLSRLALTSPIRNHYLSGNVESIEVAQRQGHFYFEVSSWLWRGEQITFIIFGVSLFLVFRAHWRSKSPLTSNKSLEPTAGRRDEHV
jgi:hypothetical protein